MLLYLFRPYSLFASFSSLCKLSYLFFAFSFETPLVLRQYSAASSLPLMLWCLYFAFCNNSFLKLCGIKYKILNYKISNNSFLFEQKKNHLFLFVKGKTKYLLPVYSSIYPCTSPTIKYKGFTPWIFLYSLISFIVMYPI